MSDLEQHREAFKAAQQETSTKALGYNSDPERRFSELCQAIASGAFFPQLRSQGEERDG